MEHFFVVILVFLALLAIFDLFVGVSNDAVNFLNSAIGSRTASFKTLLMVASLGILVGTTFSSGMMEIARSGVFNPEMFTFAEIIVVFFAVVVCDVLLLDIFNSMGLPTSTTVSLIFELLGGAVAAAVFKLHNNPDLTSTVSDFINNDKALPIITGILISVVVAFTAGTVVQFFIRLIFTFKYKKVYRYLGSVYGGIALTAIIYFLVMKGAKSSSFMHPEYVAWIAQHTWSILLYMFLILTVLFQLLISLFNANILKLVILAGTFALAFAFAGNDLVNFIGVPVAAFDSYFAYAASGTPADLFTMESLRGTIKTPTLVLLAAGLIMVLTLWMSKKARRVVQTEINLTTGSRGAKEQFGSSLMGRAIVRGTLKFDKLLRQILPVSLYGFIDKRMEKPLHQRGEPSLPFDQVRASINLVVSSILIAMATSLKLPLSTTYVTFMVAMGSSLADGAWDRESAVYRISGVLAVIGGWFLTALVAFTLCGGITYLAFAGQKIAIVCLLVLVTAMLIKLNFFTKKKTEVREELVLANKNTICRSVNAAVTKYFDALLALYRQGIESLWVENLRDLRRQKSEAMNLHEEISKKRSEYYHLVLDSNADRIDRDASHYYYRVFTNFKEISHGLRGMLGTAYNHIDNNHRIFADIMRDNMEKMMDDLDALKVCMLNYALTPHIGSDVLTQQAAKSTALVNEIQSQTMEQIDTERLSLRSSELYLNFLQFSRDVINRFALIALLQHELNEKVGK
jgi:phosphate/sulfate permease